MKILVISGFLGAGKTTFIKELAHRTHKDFAVMENEYGEVGIDGQLLSEQEGQSSEKLNIWEPVSYTHLSTNIERMNRKALEHLYTVSMEYNASMNDLNAEHPFSAMADCIREYHAEHVITGAPKDNSVFMARLWKSFPEIYFYTVSGNNEIQNIHSTPEVVTKR